VIKRNVKNLEERDDKNFSNETVKSNSSPRTNWVPLSDKTSEGNDVEKEKKKKTSLS
jgi:hypothetical protein